MKDFTSEEIELIVEKVWDKILLVLVIVACIKIVLVILAIIFAGSMSISIS